MDRRAFLLAMTLACGCGQNETPERTGAPTSAKPASANQQSPNPVQTKIPRVAVLIFGTRDTAAAAAPSLAPTLLRNRLTELGYVDGKTIVIDERYADGDAQRLAEHARAIVEQKPAVIVAIAAAATAAARQATSTVPIVMVHAGNPVGAGFVASLSNPAGNVTGTTSMVPDLGVKQVELLRELIPGLDRLGVLCNPTNAGTAPLLTNVNEAARRFNISVVVAEVTRTEDFDKALASLRDARVDALFVMIEPMIALHRTRVMEFAATNRVPTSYDVGREIARQGGLISYGPVLTNHYAVAAEYVDKILKGAKPGDLPVQQPTQFALVVNVKTAKSLGLTIPQSLLLRADEIVE